MEIVLFSILTKLPMIAEYYENLIKRIPDPGVGGSNPLGDATFCPKHIRSIAFCQGRPALAHTQDRSLRDVLSNKAKNPHERDITSLKSLRWYYVFLADGKQLSMLKDTL